MSHHPDSIGRHMNRSTGFVWDERYMWHQARLVHGPPVEPESSYESPATKRRLHSLLEVSGAMKQLVLIEPRPATFEEVTAAHDPAYVTRIQAESAKGWGEAGDFAPFGPGSYEVAMLAAGGAITAVDAVLHQRVSNAYALLRPPGHHAEWDRGRGYCIFNNEVVAVRHAHRVHGVVRSAIVDWDVHHGNGIEQAFWNDPSTLTISIHQAGSYPRTGAITDIGEGRGKGTNLNIPLPPGSGTGAYLEAFDRVVVPALRAYTPEFILVVCGYDAGALDPLGRMQLGSEAFRSMTSIVLHLADELCGGRIVFLHEGGYSTLHVPFCGLAVIEQLSGHSTGVRDPFAHIADLPYQELQIHQAAAIKAATRNLSGLTSADQRLQSS
jgi:acetoin utilization deacetylase AcuC-like enzyme